MMATLAQAGAGALRGALLAVERPAGVAGWWLRERGATFSEAHDQYFMFIFWLCTFFFALLMGLSAYFWWRYRRVEGVPTQRSPAHNIALELTWTIIPTMLLAVIFVWGLRLYLNLHIAPAGAEQVDVTARKWQWSFTYDNGGTPTETMPFADVEIPVIAVPAGKPIKLLMQSEDVIHSCYIPAFRTKLDVFPYRYTTLWFEALPLQEGEEQREHWLFCAEYCGDNHSKMYARIRVLPPEQYEQWKKDLANPYKGRSLVQVGELLYAARGCVQCHSVDGSVKTGPTWKDMWGREERIQDGSTVTVDENYIRESILDPGAKVVAGFPNQMVSYQGQLSEKDIRAIIAYIKSISEKGHGALTPDETQVQEEDGAEGG